MELSQLGEGYHMISLISWVSKNSSRSFLWANASSIFFYYVLYGNSVDIKELFRDYSGLFVSSQELPGIQDWVKLVNYFLLENRVWDDPLLILVDLSVNQYICNVFYSHEIDIWDQLRDCSRPYMVVRGPAGMNETSPQAKSVNSSQNHYF